MYKVMLVDDEPSVIERLLMVDWNKFGFSVCGTAENGEDALEIISLCDPDLVITDVKMPVIDGLTLISKSIDKLNSKARFVILSGYDEFTFAREAMKLNVSDYMLKPVDEEELEETMTKMARLICDERRNEQYTDRRLAFLTGLTIRRIIGEEDRPQLLERAGMLLDIGGSDEVKCLLIDAGFRKPTDEVVPGVDISGRKSRVREIIESNLGEYKPCLFEDSEGRFGVVLHPKMPFYNSVGSFAAKLASDLKCCAGDSVLLSVSAPGKGMDSLAEIYRQGRFAQIFGFFTGEGSLVRYEDIQYKNMDNVPCMENPKALIENICRESAGETALRIEQLFCGFLENMKAPGPVRAFVRNFEFEAIKLIEEHRGDAEEFTRLAAELDRDMDSLSMKRLQDSFLSLCLQLANQIGSLRRSDSRDIVLELKKYIKGNYSRDIKLKELAAVFYMNPVYLGQLFKKATGMQFNEYLHSVRIEEAKKLLKRTGMKVSEIALAVGYNDPKYFLSKFRSLTKHPPSDFKVMN